MHAFIDNFNIALTSLHLGNRRWFQDSLESPAITQQLDGISLTLPDITGEGFYELAAESGAGVLDAAFQVAKWVSLQSPTIIYHHGNNETPFDYGTLSKNSFKNVLYTHRQQIDANLILVRAPFHTLGLRHYFEKMGALSNFTAMFCVSVKLIEALRAFLHERGCTRVMVTGISLGGFVANLHKCFFDSADVYVPIFAGTALEDLFIASSYRKITGASVRENPDAIKSVLNFEREFAQSKKDNVFPLLALRDQLIRFDVQKKCYPDSVIKTVNKGHTTGALAFGDIRAHILSHL